MKHSLRKADEILGRVKEETEIKEHLSYVKADRTVINRNALNDKKTEDPSTMTQGSVYNNLYFVDFHSETKIDCRHTSLLSFIDRYL